MGGTRPVPGLKHTVPTCEFQCSHRESGRAADLPDTRQRWQPRALAAGLCVQPVTQRPARSLETCNQHGPSRELTQGQGTEGPPPPSPRCRWLLRVALCPGRAGVGRETESRAAGRKRGGKRAFRAGEAAAAAAFWDLPAGAAPAKVCLVTQRLTRGRPQSLGREAGHTRRGAESGRLPGQPGEMGSPRLGTVHPAPSRWGQAWADGSSGQGTLSKTSPPCRCGRPADASQHRARGPQGRRGLRSGELA